MTRDELDFIWSSFEMHIALKKTPADAWDAALVDWYDVYRNNDDRTELQRAAAIALKAMEEYDKTRQ